jgi:hypothetical protein
VEAGLEFRDQAVATTVCAFTALACHHARLFDTLAAYTAQHVGRFNEQGISNVAWAYSLMEAMMRSCPERVLQLDAGAARLAAPARRRADGPVLVPAWGAGGSAVGGVEGGAAGRRSRARAGLLLCLPAGRAWAAWAAEAEAEGPAAGQGIKPQGWHSLVS